MENAGSFGFAEADADNDDALDGWLPVMSRHIRIHPVLILLSRRCGWQQTSCEREARVRYTNLDRTHPLLVDRLNGQAEQVAPLLAQGTP